MPARIIPSFNAPDISVAKRGDKDIYAPLWTSKNIDLTNKPGVFRLSKRIQEFFSSVDDVDLTVPVCFIRTNADATDRWWAIGQGSGGLSRSSGLMWKSTGSDPVVGWVQDALVNTPTDVVENAVIFGAANGEDRLVVANDTGLDLLNSTTTANGWLAVDWWSGATGSGGLGQAALSGTFYNYIHTFLNLLMVPDGNVLHTVDDSGVVVTNRIVLPDEYEIVWIGDDGKFAYLGTRHKRGGDGLIFIWDGTSENYNYYRESGGSTTFCGRAKKGIMYTMNDQGELLKFDGDQFSAVAVLPWREYRTLWYDGGTATTLGARNTVVRQNGMAVLGDRINVLVKASLDGDNFNPLPNFPSGIWEYDEEIGFYPKSLLSHWDGVTTFGNDDDSGAPAIVNVGALKTTGETDQDQNFLAGGTVTAVETATQSQIMAPATPGSSTGLQRGYFVTTKIQGYQSFKSYWTRLQTAFRKFESTSHGIIVKYRTETSVTLADGEKDYIYISGTWFNYDGPNRFTTIKIDDSDGAKLSVGDEIEFIRGKGGGMLAHITSITNTSANLYTIVLDETFPWATGSEIFLARAMKWKKLGETFLSSANSVDPYYPLSSQSIQEKLFTIAKRSKWIQLKVELRGDVNSPELEELFLEFEPSNR